MADSHVAAMVQLLLSQVLDPTLGGISPPPLPSGVSTPYITIQKVGGRELESLGGRSGYCESIMQLNFWDKDYETADAMREAVKSFLIPAGATGYQGPAGSLFIGGINHNIDTELYDPAREVHQCITRLQVVWVTT